MTSNVLIRLWIIVLPFLIASCGEAQTEEVEAKSLENAPIELRAISEQFDIEIDVRCGDGARFWEGCHWRTQADDKVIRAHVAEFKLQEVEAGKLTEKFFQHFPKDWRDVSQAKFKWYAWPGNRDDGSRLKIWRVMAVDEQTSTLYFFYQNYDVTG